MHITERPPRLGYIADHGRQRLTRLEFMRWVIVIQNCCLQKYQNSWLVIDPELLAFLHRASCSGDSELPNPISRTLSNVQFRRFLMISFRAILAFSGIADWLLLHVATLVDA